MREAQDPSELLSQMLRIHVHHHLRHMTLRMRTGCPYFPFDVLQTSLTKIVALMVMVQGWARLLSFLIWGL